MFFEKIGARRKKIFFRRIRRKSIKTQKIFFYAPIFFFFPPNFLKFRRNLFCFLSFLANRKIKTIYNNSENFFSNHFRRKKISSAEKKYLPPNKKYLPPTKKFAPILSKK